MSFSVSVLKTINQLFPKVEHPFNLQADGKQTYAQWQFQWGKKTVDCFAPKFAPEDIFAGKTVLDMGCGASGKSLYYISIGAEKVVGVDVVEHYKAEAESFAAELGYIDKFTFLLGDALNLDLADNTFDVVIMNDFVEHIYDPERALQEALRVLKPGGRLYVNFPPYFHPTGAHLSDVIGIPWVHMLFPEKTLIEAYKDLVKGLPDEADRLNLRFGIGSDGKEHITYINKMTIKRFHKILNKLNIQPHWYQELPLRSYFALFAIIPGLKEMFVRMCVCVIEK